MRRPLHKTLFLAGLAFTLAETPALAQPLAACPPIDPRTPPALSLAECYEKINRLATAWTLYLQIAGNAKATGNPDQETLARNHAAALEPRLSRIAVTVPAPVATTPGLEIRIDNIPVDKSLWGTPLPVDPGEHIVLVTGRGKKFWQAKGFTTTQPTRLDVTIPPLEDMAERPDPPASFEAPLEPLDLPEPPDRKSLGPPIALGILAAGGLAAGIALTVASSNQRKAALALDHAISSSGGSCIVPFPDERCDELISEAQKVDTLHNLSIGSFIGAGVFAASVVTYIVWPMPKDTGVSSTTKLRASPLIGRGHGGMLVSGFF